MGRGSSMGLDIKNNKTEALMQRELASWITKTSVGNSGQAGNMM